MSRYKLLLPCFILMFLGIESLNAQSSAKAQWVENTYEQLSLEEKIGQLFVIMVQSQASEEVLAAFEKEVRDFQPGGVIFSLGTPYKQAQITNYYQTLTKVPLMISMDAEWGVAMRLDSVPQYPWNMTLGAVQDLDLIRTLGNHMGMQAKRLGVHMNFAPVADVNINPMNPIIGNRSFGSEVKNVSARALALSQGMNAAGVLTTAKHFPGHGDTEVDSHKALPVLPFSRARLNEVELYPYKTPLLQGVQGVMVAHLDVPVLTEDPGLPVSLSKKVVTDVLQTELGFEGLIFTDALNMKGASDFSPDGDVALKAFLAGNDVLVIPSNLELSVAHLKQAIENGELSELRLAHSVKKILAAKYDLGLQEYQPIPMEGLTEDLNAPIYQQTIDEAYRAAATYVVQTSSATLNIPRDAKIAYLKFGDDCGQAFEKGLISRGAHKIDLANLSADLRALEAYDYIVVGHHRSMATAYKGHKMTAGEIDLLKRLSCLETSLILAVFTKPYAVLELPFFNEIPAVFFGYQNAPQMGEYAVQVLFGEASALGQLPVTLTKLEE